MAWFDQFDRSTVSRRLGVFATAAAFVAAATCSDQPPVAPRQTTPGHASLSLSPTFAKLPSGAPVIPLSKLHAVLTGADGRSLRSRRAVRHRRHQRDPSRLPRRPDLRGIGHLCTWAQRVRHQGCRRIHEHSGAHTSSGRQPAACADAARARWSWTRRSRSSTSSSRSASHFRRSGATTLTVTGNDASGQQIALDLRRLGHPAIRRLQPSTRAAQ